MSAAFLAWWWIIGGIIWFIGILVIPACIRAWERWIAWIVWTCLFLFVPLGMARVSEIILQGGK